MPRRKIAFVRTKLDDWLPEPLTVATRIVKSLTEERCCICGSLQYAGLYGATLVPIAKRTARAVLAVFALASLAATCFARAALRVAFYQPVHGRGTGFDCRAHDLHRGT